MSKENIRWKKRSKRSIMRQIRSQKARYKEVNPPLRNIDVMNLMIFGMDQRLLKKKMDLTCSSNLCAPFVNILLSCIRRRKSRSTCREINVRLETGDTLCDICYCGDTKLLGALNLPSYMQEQNQCEEQPMTTAFEEAIVEVNDVKMMPVSRVVTTYEPST
jgi:hypothetical protein